MVRRHTFLPTLIFLALPSLSTGLCASRAREGQVSERSDNECLQCSSGIRRVFYPHLVCVLRKKSFLQLGSLAGLKRCHGSKLLDNA